MNTPARTAPALSLRAAGHTYPNGLTALQPIDLDVHAREFVCLLGPSGCGKSTLLRMMAGLLPATQGRVELQGEAPRSRSARESLSYVFQEATLMPWATVADNVRLPLDLDHVPRREADSRVTDALAQVGLSAFHAQRPHELSGGMQMRVSIARGLVTRPRVLLLDEPFGALDDITRQRLDADLLALWQQADLTVVFVTHSLAEAAFLASRVVVMAPRPGRIVRDESLAQPWPRPARYRTSAEFNAIVQGLQDTLAEACGEPT